MSDDRNTNLEKFKRMDLFGKLFVFEMHKGDRMHRTVIGSIMTLLLVPVTITYGVMRFNVMLGYDDSNILIVDHLNYWTEDDVITTSKDNFQVAFAFVNYQDSSESLKNLPEYGEIGAYYKTWGDTDNPGTFYKSIPSRPCTAKELNLEEKSDDDELKFWPSDS